MKNIPKKIYLQIGEADESTDNFNDLHQGSITWCDERIYDNDIEYVLNKKS